MTSVRRLFPLLLVLLCFAVCVPRARADTFGFYNTGSFQYDAMTISGMAEGTCEGECLPWGSIVILDVTFNATVTNYEQAVSCANGECETTITGDLGPGSVSAEISIFGDSSQTFRLNSNVLTGAFDSRFCTGHCGTYRAESDLTLNFQGSWDNDWQSNGIIQMECFHNGGCVDGTGGGSLTTATPEPAVIMLLLGDIPCLYVAIRRRSARLYRKP